MKKKSSYYAYLLRCWQENDANDAPSPSWRFSLEGVRDGQRHGFATPEALLAFLRQSLPQESDNR